MQLGEPKVQAPLVGKFRIGHDPGSFQSASNPHNVSKMQINVTLSSPFLSSKWNVDKMFSHQYVAAS
jgi:hypothetical protein